MRYAELTFLDRSEDLVQVLVRFDDVEARDQAAYDFGLFYGYEGTFRDVPWREARARYDLKRFDRPRYRVEVTVADRVLGETRELEGIYQNWYEEELQQRALDMTRDTRVRYRPAMTLDQLLDTLD